MQIDVQYKNGDMLRVYTEHIYTIGYKKSTKKIQIYVDESCGGMFEILDVSEQDYSALLTGVNDAKEQLIIKIRDTGLTVIAF